MFRNLIKQDVFPPDWLVMKMVVNNIVLNSLQELSQPLIFCFLDTRHNFDGQVLSRLDWISILVQCSGGSKGGARGY